MNSHGSATWGKDVTNQKKKHFNRGARRNSCKVRGTKKGVRPDPTGNTKKRLPDSNPEGFCAIYLHTFRRSKTGERGPSEKETTNAGKDRNSLGSTSREPSMSGLPVNVTVGKNERAGSGSVAGARF